MFRIIFISIIFFSSFGYATQPLNFFLKHEFNATDSITGVGTTATIGYPNSLVKGELVTSFNYAEILDEVGIKHDFLTLDTGVRLGIYGKFFVYIEAGFDAFEIILDSTRDDNRFNDSQENNAIDGYASLGAGVNAKNIRIEGFVKARQIDGDYWDIDKQIFYGIQLSLFF